MVLNDDKWKAFATSVYVRETFPDFEDLISLMDLILEKVLESRHTRFTHPQEEEGGETQEDAAVVDLKIITKTNMMQKM